MTVFSMLLRALFASCFLASVLCQDTPWSYCSWMDPIDQSKKDALVVGAQMLSYFNDPGYGNTLSLPAQPTYAGYFVGRESGSVSLRLRVNDPLKTADQEDIPLADALNALMDLFTSCTSGYTFIGKGQWVWSMWDSKMFCRLQNNCDQPAALQLVEGKDARFINSTVVAQHNATSSHSARSLSKRANMDTSTVSRVADWPILRVGLKREPKYFGQDIAGFDEGEEDVISSLGQGLQQMMIESEGGTNELNVGNVGNMYQAFMTMRDFGSWSEVQNLLEQSGGLDLVQNFTTEAAYDLAGNAAVVGTYRWQIDPPFTNKPSRTVNLVLVRLRLRNGDGSSSCQQQNCQCKKSQADVTLNMPNEDEISISPDDFPTWAYPLSKPMVKTRGEPASMRARAGMSRPLNRPSHLFKRYNLCSGALDYDNNNYPSTAQSPGSTDTTKADNIAAISKWWDYELIATPTWEICHWQLIQAPARVVPHEYATEHVFEKHLIKSFLMWVTNEKKICGFVRSTCVDASSVFNQRAPNTFFATRSPLEQMAGALSDNNRLGEFYILRDKINTAKTVILSYNLEFQGVPGPKDTWEETLEQLRIYSMVFAYINRQDVSQIFHATHARMRAILAQVDLAAPTYIGPRFCADDVDPSISTPQTWDGLFIEWTYKFFAYKQTKMMDWHIWSMATLRSQINAQVSSETRKKQLIEDVDYLADTGRYLNVGAFTFDYSYSSW